MLIPRETLKSGWNYFLTKLLAFLNFCVFVFTTPWECLRMPIDHILQLQAVDRELQIEKIRIWCDNKKGEYCYVAMSGAVVASAVTASFSWNVFHADANASWLTLGTWYGSIIFSLMSVMVAFHHLILFTNFGTDPKGSERILRAISKDVSGDGELKPDIIFLYALQVPGMLLSIALVSYLIGLSLLVVIPLQNKECMWGEGMKTAVVYLGYSIFGIINYILVCLVVYRKCHLIAVDSDQEGSS